MTLTFTSTTESSIALFGVPVYTLQRKKYGEEYYNTISPNLLTPKEKLILQNLINE